jgi:Ca-activated chloride channel homolog
MRFEQLSLLTLLLLIPLYFVVNQWIRKNKDKELAQLGHLAAVKKLIKNFDEKIIFYQQILMSLAFAFLVIALANPLWGLKNEEVKIRQSDVIIALDISQSMLCEDLKPSRLENAKLIAQQLITQLKAERIGIIVFAGEAYVQMPLTTDYTAANFFIQSANTDLAEMQGTAIGKAINTALDLRKNSKKPCSLLILTDGESHDEDATSEMENAVNQGVTPFVIGVGTVQGGFIPIKNGSFEISKKDENGNPILSKMNPEILKSLAQTGKGEYTDITAFDKGKIEDWQQKILLKGEDGDKKNTYTDLESHFQLFLFLAIFLFIFAYLSSWAK